MPVMEAPFEEVEASATTPASPTGPEGRTPQASPRRRSWRAWVWAACVMCGLVAAPFLYWSTRPRAQFENASGPTFRPSVLGLSVRPQANQLLLAWNAAFPAVKNANRAVLSITDGGRSEDVDLYLPEFLPAA